MKRMKKLNWFLVFSFIISGTLIPFDGCSNECEKCECEDSSVECEPCSQPDVYEEISPDVVEFEEIQPDISDIAEVGDIIEEEGIIPNFVENEPNDPNYEGGTPNEISLPAQGEQLIIRGNVHTPVVSEYGTKNPDLDFFVFNAQGGEYLKITGLADGNLSTAFYLMSESEVGPESIYYQRAGINLEGKDITRQIYIPFPGRYDLIVSDLSNILCIIHWLCGLPYATGGDDFNYYIVIERIEPPESVEINASSGSLPLTNEGEIDPPGNLALFHLNNSHPFLDVILHGYSSSGIRSDLWSILVPLSDSSEALGEIFSSYTGKSSRILIPADTAYYILLDHYLVEGSQTLFNFAFKEPDGLNLGTITSGSQQSGDSFIDSEGLSSINYFSIAEPVLVLANISMPSGYPACEIYDSTAKQFAGGESETEQLWLALSPPDSGTYYVNVHDSWGDPNYAYRVMLEGYTKVSVNETEPNNTLSSAQLLTGSSVSISASFSWGDSDYYAIDLTASGSSNTLVVSLSPSPSPPYFSGCLTIMDSSGTPVAAPYFCSPFNTASFTVPSNGRYYIHLDNPYTTTTGDYTLNVIFKQN